MQAPQHGESGLAVKLADVPVIVLENEFTSEEHDRGRDPSYLAPPAQIRTCGFPAYGLYGAFFVKGASRYFCRALLLHSLKARP